MKLDRAAVGEYFELDFGGSRLTHVPSGDTCLRHPWMSGPRIEAWDEKLSRFFRKHSNVSTIVNSRLEVIGNADEFPYRGGGFEIGDTVMVRNGVGDASREFVATEVVGRNEDDGSFRLENGMQLFWNAGDCGWFAWRREPYVSGDRARKPLEGEIEPEFVIPEV